MAPTVAEGLVIVPPLVPPFALLERDGGDVSLHATLKEIELFVEPADADVHIVYDSQGYVLYPRAINWRTVKLEWDGGEPRPHELQCILRDYLRSVGGPSGESADELDVVRALAAIQRLQGDA